MFRIAVCDDSSFDLSTMSSYLSELNSSKIYAEVYPFSSGAELISEYEKGRSFQCVVLDMLMTPMNGIETAKKIRAFDIHVPILIVTSTVQYALEGYQVNAWRYLMKPVDKKVFLDEIISIYKEQEQEKPNYYTVSNETGLHRVRYSDIMYFESDRHRIKLRLQNGEHYFRGSISEIEERMAAFNFFRVHKSFVVNLRHIKSIHKGNLLMENGDTVFVSKHRSAKLYEAMLDYAEQSYDG